MSKTTPDLTSLEKKRVDELRRIVSGLDSTNPSLRYTAAGKMIAAESGKSLLAKALDLFRSSDSTMRRLATRTVGRNAYGPYVRDLFTGLCEINPAEREQVLQVIEESMQRVGPPRHPREQTRWIEALTGLGREHQPTVFGLMALLGPKAIKWVESRIKDHIETLSLGSVQRLSSFPEPAREQLIRLAIRQSSTKKRELLPYLLELLDQRTIQLVAPFMKEASWQERVQIASRVARVGVTTSAGLIMDLMADPDWRVKQEFLEHLNVASSKFTILLQILGYLVSDSHARVRAAADRALLILGTTACAQSDIETQRKRLMRRFRKQLLRAAPQNGDLDSSWLGVEIPDTDVFPVFTEEEEMEMEREDVAQRGVSLEDLRGPKTPLESVASSSAQLDIIAALRKKRRDVSGPDDDGSAVPSGSESVPEADMAVSDRVVRVLKEVSKKGRTVKISVLRERLLNDGVSESDFDLTIRQLERDGIVYRSSEDTIGYVDLDL
ncbi:MAG: hypothetical protein HXY34_13815 [Candidatus Thorarchaeota archaeon]|nr:hypothetical protein [Candidatus Thorarchaeota archaeon]